MADAKMRIGIIGVGNVGVHLTRLFMQSGLEVFLCASQQNTAFLPGFPSDHFFDQISALPTDLDLIFFTRRDRDLDSVLAELPKHNTLIHCSGSLDLRLLHDFAHSGVFYPLQTFRKELDLQNADFPVFIEASDAKTEDLLRALAVKLSLKVFAADLELRSILHLSGVFSSNFVNLLYALAYDQISGQFDSKEVLLPLMKETLSRLEHGHPDNFQTGPALRNDDTAMKRHVQMLKDQPEMQKLYLMLSEIIKKRHS